MSHLLRWDGEGGASWGTVPILRRDGFEWRELGTVPILRQGSFRSFRPRQGVRLMIGQPQPVRGDHHGQPGQPEHQAASTSVSQ